MEYTFENKTPGDLARDLVTFSAEYQNLSEQLYAILKVKPAKWNIIRDQVSSDKQAERIWEETSDGINETRIKLRMKSIDKMMGSIKTYLRVLDSEAKNLY